VNPARRGGDFRRADFGRADFGRADFGRADFGRADFGRADFGRPDSGGPNQKVCSIQWQHLRTTVANVLAGRGTSTSEGEVMEAAFWIAGAL
jgi:hypothetical protein